MDEQQYMQLLIDMHIGGSRQGPGTDDETRLAIALSGIKKQSDLKIADIGCGSGAATHILAQELDAHITAIDFLPEFLQKLEDTIADADYKNRITTLAKSMDDLPFSDGELDAIWSEGAIYNMGFEAGVQAWRPLLKQGGILAVSEITWLTNERPEALTNHWNAEYPEVDTASAKITILENSGYVLLGYFALPKSSWMDTYYTPLRNRWDAFLEKHNHSDDAKAIVEGEKTEIALYEQYSDYVSYGYYVARKI